MIIQVKGDGFLNLLNLKHEGKKRSLFYLDSE